MLQRLKEHQFIIFNFIDSYLSCFAMSNLKKKEIKNLYIGAVQCPHFCRHKLRKLSLKRESWRRSFNIPCLEEEYLVLKLERSLYV